jgi:hypothetical protein
MKIKTKLNLGVGLLFLMIIILISSGILYFSIKKDTENILKANYNTLEYSRNMLLSLDENNNEERAIIILKPILKTNCHIRRLAKTKRPIICRKRFFEEK